jgi:3-oxoacyl-[acyl-carrier protein] reductase
VGEGRRFVDLGISGKRAAVAASSSGLGRACAEALVAEGVEVVMCSRDRERIEAAALEVGGRPVVADLATREGATAFVAEATALLGGLDILVLNVGGSPAGTALGTPLDLYPEALEQHVMAPIAMCHAAVPAMRAQGWGRVVAITSLAVRQPIPTLTLSNSTRTGLTGYLKTLALEVAVDGVTVNSVQPGYHGTARLTAWAGDRLNELIATVPAGRIGDPAGLGAAVAFLCSEAAGFITGVGLPIDGGENRALL